MRVARLPRITVSVSDSSGSDSPAAQGAVLHPCCWGGKAQRRRRQQRPQTCSTSFVGVAAGTAGIALVSCHRLRPASWPRHSPREVRRGSPIAPEAAEAWRCDWCPRSRWTRPPPALGAAAGTAGTALARRQRRRRGRPHRHRFQRAGSTGAAPAGSAAAAPSPPSRSSRPRRPRGAAGRRAAASGRPKSGRWARRRWPRRAPPPPSPAQCPRAPGRPS
mmetsp:Transcript_126178/g.356830  ORF Transcript_126178/g.356830 Transcript_126178/m.356830 type:complete len:219 (+) Transcript_126178:254-910(+)